MIPQITNTAEDFFYEMFYGYGGLITVIILVSLILLVSSKNRWAGIAFIPISVIIGLNYLTYVTPDNGLMWGAIIMFLMPFFIILSVIWRND